MSLLVYVSKQLCIEMTGFLGNTQLHFFPYNFNSSIKEVASRLSSSFCQQCHLHIVKCYGTYVMCRWQNDSFMSREYVSQAVFQMLQTKQINFEKRLG